MSEQPPQPERTGPAIGADEWVARSDERAQRRGGIAGRAQALYERIPKPAVFAFFVGLAVLMPLLTAQTDNDIYFLRVGTVALVFAHEWGHVIQQRTGTSASSTVSLELQADCFAGAWTWHATTTQQDPFNLEKGELDQALSGYLSFRDPTGTSPAQEGAHGSAFDRIAAFSDGYNGGAERCKNYATNPPIVTEIPFTSSADAAREGNLPFGDVVTAVRKDLTAYWKSVRGTAPVSKLVASARRAERCAGRDARPVVACSAHTVAYAPDALRAVYEKYGDYAVATLMAEAWADATVLDGGLDRAASPGRRAAECVAGAWAGDLVNGNRATNSTLSPGDLDEAVSALLAFRGRSTPGNNAFVRFRAFRRGFVDGARACGLSTAKRS